MNNGVDGNSPYNRPELPSRGDEDGLGVERVPQAAAGGGAREEGSAFTEQPHLQLPVPPPPEQQLLLWEHYACDL